MGAEKHHRFDPGESPEVDMGRVHHLKQYFVDPQKVIGSLAHMQCVGTRHECSYQGAIHHSPDGRTYTPEYSVHGATLMQRHVEMADMIRSISLENRFRNHRNPEQQPSLDYSRLLVTPESKHNITLEFVLLSQDLEEGVDIRISVFNEREKLFSYLVSDGLMQLEEANFSDQKLATIQQIENSLALRDIIDEVLVMNFDNLTENAKRNSGPKEYAGLVGQIEKQIRLVFAPNTV